MANPEVSGKIVGFQMSEAELAKKIKQYKEMVANGEIEMPFWTDFREFLGIRQDVLDELMERAYFAEDANKSAYHNRALMIKMMGETCENYLNTHPGWGGKNAVKSMMLLKQGLGYTKKYADERNAGKQPPSKIKINISSVDPRVKDMGK